MFRQIADPECLQTKVIGFLLCNIDDGLHVVEYRHHEGGKNGAAHIEA